MSRGPFFTPIKRSHLVTTSGVGSLVRTRNGVTALVKGLADWESTIPIASNLVGPDRDIARARFLKTLTLRDAELENACDVGKFIEPQSLPERPKYNEDWLIPITRFPLAGFCSNWKCGRIHYAQSDNPNVIRCSHCASKKYKPVLQQMPIFKVCQLGHIDEINWFEVIHDNCPHACTSKQLKAKLGNSLKHLIGECDACKCKSDPDSYAATCTGVKAWLPDSQPDLCSETMRVVERTSVQVYFSNVKSAIHLPSEDDLSDALLEWILNYGNIEHIDLGSEIQLNGMIGTLRDLNIQVVKDELIRHIEYLKAELDSHVSQVWTKEESRIRELDVLLSSRDVNPKYGPKLLEKRLVNLESLPSDLFGKNGIFESVVAIDKLTETRVQDGFTRFTPEMPSTSAGQKLMWGLGDKKSPWLPGYRVYGEGILFVLNPSKVHSWKLKFTDYSKSRVTGTTLTHTLAHLILAQAALDCGYQVAGIRDRIYELTDGRLGFLIYAAEGDSVGTLGGLVDLSEPGKLEHLVRDALAEGQWCAADPVCISETSHQMEHMPGACHHCVLLPETSCEVFNQDLDRATIYGNTERDIPSFLPNGKYSKLN